MHPRWSPALHGRRLCPAKGEGRVTFEPAYWKLPTSINKVQPEVGHQINFISAAATHRSLDREIDGETNTSSTQRTRMAKTTPPPPPTPDKLAIFYRQLSMTSTGSAILSVLPDYCELFRDPVLPIRSLQSLVTGTGLNRRDLPALQRHCQIIKIVADVSEEQAVQMERQTRGQHTSSLWFAARAGRVTASSMHGVYGTDLSSTALSIVKRVCYPACGPGTAATIWGIRQEEAARQAYTAQTAHQHTDQQVQTCGFFVNPAFPQVGASPDAIVTCTCCGKGCVEVKCPEKYKDCTILQACSSEDRNFCLYVVNGQVHLKKNHQYYTQVQTQLFVTESSYCDFVVWTLMDTVILRIAPDTAFWKARLQKAQDYFVKVALPELAVQYLTIPPTSQPSSGHSVLRELQQSKPQQIGGKRQRKQHAQKAKEVWCLCAGPEEGEMVACDNQNCPVQWYHFSCVGLVDKPSADTPWFCPSCAE
ncbi:uncharacterized protein LOC114459273 [Gouania willdenowi]|uniref:uncharacterized protein LOC114459273 n=1 Tax=Gouania willdenowi TaxID=441366 RepID=UPI0010546020|nr:uncharacterized protein LOC114459273 [Gouania willdenowi]